VSRPTPARTRRAGHGRAEDGSVITWSMAEGGRGSRWREVRVEDGAIVSSLLLELDPEGRFSHLELSTVAGLLTLHPESDGTLHGNAVGATGVRHFVALPWSPDEALLVAGSAIARAAAARVPRRRDGGAARVGVVVGLDLAVERRALGSANLAIELDADGLPVLAGGVSWPIELEE